MSEPVIPTEIEQLAAAEVNDRRKARKSLIDFTCFTLPQYKPAWFHRVIGSFLEKITRSEFELDGIMIFMPPRYGKSELVSVRWPAYDLGHRPDEHFISATYGDELANTFSVACRNTVESPPYQRLWTHQLKTRNDTKWQIYRTNDDQRASYIATGILSAITGQGASRLCVDDPVKNAEEAYSLKLREKTYANYLTAAGTRMAPGGKKLLCMTRWHYDDLAGRLLKKAVDNKEADQWLVIVFAATNDTGEDAYIWNTKTGEKQYFKPYDALWPEAYPREALDKQRANMGGAYWNAMYMQRPSELEGSIFKRDNWGWFDRTTGALEHLIQVYDTAHEEKKENDYSASITLGATSNSFPILDAWRDQVSFPKLVAKVYERWEECKVKFGRLPDRICVENKGSGISLAQQIDANNIAGRYTFPDGVTKNVPLIPCSRIPATLAKEVRAHGISGYHEARGILLPRGADWVDDFIDEHALFPKGLHDDWVDCTVHGVTYFTREVEEREEIVIHDEHVAINEHLDEFDLQQFLSDY